MSYPGYYGAQYHHQGGYTLDDPDVSPIDDLFSPAEPRYQHDRHYSHGEFGHYGGDGYNDHSYQTYTTREMPVFLDTDRSQSYAIHPRSDSKSTMSSHRRHDSSAPSTPDERYYILPQSRSHTSSMSVGPPSASRASQLTPLECRHAPVHHRTSPASSGGRPYCMHPDCLDPATGQPIKSFSRKADVGRHMKSQHEPKYIDCPFKRCTRKGDNGFTRQDHLIEHQRQYHGQDIRKRGSVGSGEKRSSGGGRHRA